MNYPLDDPRCPDEIALADVVIPDHPPAPKEYTPEGRAEWAREMAELYPDGFVYDYENHLVDELASQYDHGAQQPGAEAFVLLMQQGLTLEQACKSIGVSFDQMAKAWYGPTAPYPAEALFAAERAYRCDNAAKIKDVAAATGLSVSASQRMRRAVLGDNPQVRPPNATYSAETKERIFQMRDEGRSYKEIAEETGVKYHNVVAAIRRRNGGRLADG